MQIGKRLGDSFIKAVLALHKRIAQEKPEFIKSISEYYNNDGLVCLIDAKYGSRLILGEGDLNLQLKRYQFVLDNGDFNKHCVLDLRFKDQVVVKPEEK